MRNSSIAPLIILLFISVSGLQAQQEELKVLFVGNSYTYRYNLPHIVSLISEETSTKLLTRKITAGGATLKQHWKGQRNLRAKQIISEGDFDVVVLQGFSMAAIASPDTTLRYIRLFCEYIRSHGAEPCLFNTWAREKVPQLQVEIDDMYSLAANENDAILAPVGEAWELAMDLRPGVNLYTYDGSHPTELGTMLSAAVFVKVLTGELPEILPSLYRIEDKNGETARLMSHNPEDAEFCRRIVNQVIE